MTPATLHLRGVYLIKHDSGRAYVGSALKSFRASFRTHKELLRKGRHWNFAMQTDVAAGLDKFSYVVFKPCDSAKECLEEEQKLLDSEWETDKLYNEIRVAGEPLLRLTGRPVGSIKTSNKRVTLQLAPVVAEFLEDVAESRGVSVSAAANIIVMSIVQGDQTILDSLAQDSLQRKQF